MPRTKTNFGVIGSPVTLSQNSTKGIFTLQDQSVGSSQGLFPLGPLSTVFIEYLVQGGGGGGSYGTSGSHFGAGGAAGVARASNTSVSKGTSYTVTVGAGGAQQVNGSNSTLILDTTVLSTGGQGPPDTQKNGGYNADYLGGVWVASSTGGGGAGAGGPGGTAGGVNVQDGGTGYLWTAGDGVRRGGGGGSGANGLGGAGGGGNGSATNVAAAGSPNTGSGGGGDNATYYAGGAGGSGVIIIKYADTIANLSSIGVGLTYTWSSNNGYKFYTFTGGTGTIIW